MASALDVARCFLELASREPVPDGLTNSRLQSLLYYAQGWHLGSFDRPLFPDQFDLGPHGPAVADVTRAIEATANDPLRVIRPGELGPCALPFRDRQFVAAIWEKYRGYSATGLRDLVFAEQAWVEPGAEQADTSGIGVISPVALRRYFLRRDELRGFDPAEWEAVTRGEEQLARGEGVPWVEVRARLRERQLPTHPVPGSH